MLSIIVSRLQSVLTTADEEGFFPYPDFAEIRARFGREDALEFYSHHNPHDIWVDSPWGYLQLFSFGELEESQYGYSYDEDGPRRDWPEGFLVIGHCESDPIAMEETASGPIYHAFLSSGGWDFTPIAEDLGEFLSIVLAWNSALDTLDSPLDYDNKKMRTEHLRRFAQIARTESVSEKHIDTNIDLYCHSEDPSYISGSYTPNRLWR